MVASLYLLNEINKKTTSKDINLYEGFVSFKDKKTTTNHLKDVLILRKIIDSPNLRQSNIFEENALKFDDTDQLQSALLVTGIDTGIPPVIMNIG
jgi:hypothetical protein